MGIPTVVMEGRAPLRNQLVTRQEYLPKELEKQEIQTVYIRNEESGTYDALGRIQRYTPYGSKKIIQATLDPGSYAWRLRDPIWATGDPVAYPDGHGYNSRRARKELGTRRGLANVLGEIGLDEYGVETIAAIAAQDWQPGERIFVKPDLINDISERAGTRARLESIEEIHERTASSVGAHVFQRQQALIAARELVDHLGIHADALDPHLDYLHAVRVFAPLWLPPNKIPAVELRLTDPQGGIGTFFATHQYLLEPHYVRERLPLLAKLHRRVHHAFVARYGEQNYLTFDYLVQPDGSAKILNGLVRGLTPNLERQPQEVQHLANATADVEVQHLAALAQSRPRTA